MGDEMKCSNCLGVINFDQAVSYMGTTFVHRHTSDCLRTRDADLAALRAENERLRSEIRDRDELVSIIRTQHGARMLADCDEGYTGEDMAPHDWLVCCLNELNSSIADSERKDAEIARLRAERSKMDCRFAGDTMELSGSHCPLDRPCDRCKAEQEIANLTERNKALDIMLQSSRDAGDKALSDLAETKRDIEWSRTCEAVANTAIKGLKRDVGELREAALAVLKDQPIVDCDSFHHPKRDQKHAHGECPARERWESAVERLAALLEG